MAKLLVIGTCGPGNATRASLPFQTARGAIESGYDVEIMLEHDGTLILDDAARKYVVGVGLPPLEQLFQFVVQNNVRIYVRRGCAGARGLKESDLKGKNAEFIDRKRYAQLLFESDKVLIY